MQSILEQVEIERLAADRYRLTFPAGEGGGLEVRSSLSAAVDRGVCAVTPVGAGPLDIAGLPPAPQHFFHIYRGGEQIGIVSHRHIPLEGTPNFRDFGGYVNCDGRFVRWGRLYRSGLLSALTETDLAHFEGLGIGLVCDFRRDDERTREPSRWPPQAPPHVESLPLAPGNQAMTLKNLLRGDTGLAVPDVVEAMKAINREFVLEHAAVYGRLLRLVLESDKAVLIHCAAGKDRTGFGAAIILAALGVPEAAIMRDYMLTANYFVAHREIEKLAARHSIPVQTEVIEPVVEVRPEYLQAAFDSIRQEYGDIGTYLKAGLGFGADAQAALKSRLLV